MMKRIVAVAAALLSGCTGQSAPEPTPTPSTPAVVQLDAARAVNLPVGTAVDIGHVTVTAISPDSHTDISWAFRVRTCMNSGSYTSGVTYLKWEASSGGGERVAAATPPVAAEQAYGRPDSELIRPGECAEGLVYFPLTSEPDAVYYVAGTGITISWRIK